MTAHQGNHLHLIVEAEDATALSRGVKGLAIRVARGLNRLAGRRGRALADRYHSRPLATPTEVRNALAYVLTNSRVHARRHGARRYVPRVDPYSSGQWFDGWRSPPRGKPVLPAPTAAPSTWLLATGWRRLGLL